VRLFYVDSIFPYRTSTVGRGRLMVDIVICDGISDAASRYADKDRDTFVA
jgi:hypothetical protein